ncbi:hypothetical protein ACFL2H_03735, partial [Planctomycetota bacterium]
DRRFVCHWPVPVLFLIEGSRLSTRRCLALEGSVVDGSKKARASTAPYGLATVDDAAESVRKFVFTEVQSQTNSMH